ncbi:hypothetical protein, partial [Candidatus Hakubella thermalkaliphila]|uniref:hypothetical protein n=1 Tax=Candidatus Hakubella thermalkaliphila TaxID=2754717 RepID=UPI001C6114E3
RTLVVHCGHERRSFQMGNFKGELRVNPKLYILASNSISMFCKVYFLGLTPKDPNQPTKPTKQFCWLFAL